MKKQFILFLAFCLIHINSVYSQNTDYLTKFADTLFAQGKFEESLQCYQRMYFFGINSEDNCVKSAKCFIALDNTKQAIKSLQSAQRITKIDSVKAVYGFDIVSIYITKKEPKLALLELYNIDTLNNNFFR